MATLTAEALMFTAKAIHSLDPKEEQV